MRFDQNHHGHGHQNLLRDISSTTSSSGEEVGGGGGSKECNCIVQDYMGRLVSHLNVLESELRYAWHALDTLSHEYMKMWDRLEKLEVLLYEQQSVIAQLLDIYGHHNHHHETLQLGGGSSSPLALTQTVEEEACNRLLLEEEEEEEEEAKAKAGDDVESVADDEAFYRSLNSAHRDSLSLLSETTEPELNFDTDWDAEVGNVDLMEQDILDILKAEVDEEVYTANDYKAYKGNSPCVSDQDLAQLDQLSAHLEQSQPNTDKYQPVWLTNEKSKAEDNLNEWNYEEDKAILYSKSPVNQRLIPSPTHHQQPEPPPQPAVTTTVQDTLCRTPSPIDIIHTTHQNITGSLISMESILMTAAAEVDDGVRHRAITSQHPPDSRPVSAQSFTPTNLIVSDSGYITIPCDNSERLLLDSPEVNGHNKTTTLGLGRSFGKSSKRLVSSLSNILPTMEDFRKIKRGHSVVNSENVSGGQKTLVSRIKPSRTRSEGSPSPKPRLKFVSTISSLLIGHRKRHQSNAAVSGSSSSLSDTSGLSEDDDQQGEWPKVTTRAGKLQSQVERTGDVATIDLIKSFDVQAMFPTVGDAVSHDTPRTTSPGVNRQFAVSRALGRYRQQQTEGVAPRLTPEPPADGTISVFSDTDSDEDTLLPLFAKCVATSDSVSVEQSLVIKPDEIKLSELTLKEAETEEKTLEEEINDEISKEHNGADLVIPIAVTQNDHVCVDIGSPEVVETRSPVTSMKLELNTDACLLPTSETATPAYSGQSSETEGPDEVVDEDFDVEDVDKTQSDILSQE